MNKKFVIGGAAAALAALGIAKYVNGQKSKDQNLEDKWTTGSIPDLTGKVIIVTGGNSGIGFEAAKAFAHNGAQTILACRNIEKAQAALSIIEEEMPDAPAEIMLLDLASLDSVHHFAEEFKAKYERLDVLVNNAGIMMVPYGHTADGFERQIGTNHLGHFALTGLLNDVLLKTPGSRVVNISSIGHKNGSIDFDDFMYENSGQYDPQAAYGRSKLANILFTFELQRRYEAMGADVIAVAAHPGVSMTNLLDHMNDRWYFQIAMVGARFYLQSAAMGALPMIRAAVDPYVQGGEYYGPEGSGERKGYPVIVQASDACYNLADAKKLWEISEELTGVTYLEPEPVPA